MTISKQTLETILSLKKRLEDNCEPDGRYCLYNYHFNNSIEYTDDNSGPHYIKNKKTGDFVSECIIENNVYTGNRKIIWTERIASVEENSPALTQGLSSVLSSGDCVCVLKEMNTGTPENTKICYVVDQYITIPENYVGLIQHNTPNKIGFVVVVPATN